jgi:hypothetical protein
VDEELEVAPVYALQWHINWHGISPFGILLGAGVAALYGVIAILTALPIWPFAVIWVQASAFYATLQWHNPPEYFGVLVNAVAEVRCLTPFRDKATKPFPVARDAL